VGRGDNGVVGAGTKSESWAKEEHWEAKSRFVKALPRHKRIRGVLRKRTSGKEGNPKIVD